MLLYVMLDQANLAELILHVPRKLYSWLEWVTEGRNGVGEKKPKKLQLLYTKGINVNIKTTFFLCCLMICVLTSGYLDYYVR